MTAEEAITELHKLSGHYTLTLEGPSLDYPLWWATAHAYNGGETGEGDTIPEAVAQLQSKLAIRKQNEHGGWPNEQRKHSS